MNIKFSQELVQNLVDQGVRDFVVCAGARNSPLIKVLSAASHAEANLAPALNVHYFFDERAAGFFALGRARRDERAVAVVTTSGTAVAELLPAAIEAHYSNTGLVFITADRPRSYRGTGAPQSIEQMGLFSSYVVRDYDLLATEDFQKVEIEHHRTVHVNVGFDEPLIDAVVGENQIRVDAFSQPARSLQRLASENENLSVQTNASSEQWAGLQNFKRPLIILGGLSNENRSGVFEILQMIKAPIYAEAQSGLRAAAGLENLTLQSGAKLFSENFFRANFDSVIRLGSVPTLRLWRDLEGVLKDVPVLNVSETAFSGLSREKNAPLAFSDFFAVFREQRYTHAPAVREADRRAYSMLITAMKNAPQSEPSWFKILSEAIPQDSVVMLGNSLPIREWDFAAQYTDNRFKVYGNRGANGIDGLIATFLGLAEGGRDNWLILGDLSALYDLNALAFVPTAARDARLRIVVINNQGGQIFRPMFKDQTFLNSHNFEFSKWAEMFGLKYLKFSKTRDRRRFKQLTEAATILEIQPDLSQSEELWGLM